jgi:hypothetical protein
VPGSRDIETGIIITFEVIFAFLAIQAVLIQDISRFYNVLVAMAITLLPVLTEKMMNISLPFGVKSIVPFALFLHLAGGIMRWYWIYMPFYDKFAHIISSLAIALVVFVFFLVLDYYGLKFSKVKVFFGIFVITLILGGIWEVGEKTLDIMLRSSYNNGMIDTIGDTIGNFIGIVIALMIANYYVKSIPKGESMAYLIRNKKQETGS